MTNVVYSMVVRALSGVVSERAAETMLQSILRDQNLNSQTVTAEDMQKVLSGPLLARLSMVLPAARARQELLALARQLEVQYPKAPTLFTENVPFAAWEESADATGTGWGDVSLGADDFEFEDPEYTLTTSSRAYQLESALGQEELLQDLARLAGVQGVMVCRASGEVLRVRAIRDAAGLGGVVAATALLFQRRALRLMSAELGGQTVCMRPLGAYCVAVVAGAGSNVGRLLVELQHLKVAA